MKLFVWDYHGVLEKGNEKSSQFVTNFVLEKFGYKERLNDDQSIQLYGKKWFQYFEFLLPYETHERHLELQKVGFDFSINNFDLISKNFKPNPHAHLVLEQITKKHNQILISNCNPESLKLYINAVKINNFFPPHIIFAANPHSKKPTVNKINILTQYLRNKTFDDIIIIGDSPSDMELKKVAGGKTYLYCHPELKHRKCEADLKIQDLREILKEI